MLSALGASGEVTVVKLTGSGSGDEETTANGGVTMTVGGVTAGVTWGTGAEVEISEMFGDTTVIEGGTVEDGDWSAAS